MEEIFNQIWNLAVPILGAALCSLALAVLTWASHAVRASEWYARQPLWHRKLIDLFAVWGLSWVSKRLVWSKDIEIALQRPVKELMPAADALRDPVSKQITDTDADMLTRAAVEAAKTKLSRSDFGRKIPRFELEKAIADVVPAVVKKEKKRRKANPNQKGGAGAHP